MSITLPLGAVYAPGVKSGGTAWLELVSGGARSDGAGAGKGGGYAGEASCISMPLGAVLLYA